MKPLQRGYSTLPATIGAVAIGAVLIMSATPLIAHDGQHHVIEIDDIEFKPGPPTLPPGVEYAVLAGSPMEEGPFVMRLKFPANYAVPPHRHPQNEDVTVISGGLGMAMGERHDTTAAPVYKPGSFIHIPTGEAHFAWTEEETVVQINAMGPFGIEYVNPQDDPRTN